VKQQRRKQEAYITGQQDNERLMEKRGKIMVRTGHLSTTYAKLATMPVS